MEELFAPALVTTATLLLGERLHRAGGPLRWLLALGCWWAAALALSVVGLFGTGTRSPLLDTAGFAALAVLMAVAVLALVRWRRRPQVAAAVRRLPLALLVGVQVYRIGGTTFLAAGAAGELAPALAWVTASWDLVIGLSAPVLAVALVRRHTWAATATRWWAVLGLADFAVGVTAASLTFPLVGVGALVDGIAPLALGTHPLAFVSLFAVPLSIALHLEVLSRLPAIAHPAPPRTEPLVPGSRPARRA